MADVQLKAVAKLVPWWAFLVTGIAWTIIAWVVLRFDYTSARAIATLAGIVILLAAAAEVFNMIASPGWKWLHAILAVVFAITGIVALINPGRTFVWLAAFIGWYLLFKGITDIMLAFVTKGENDAWWLSLIVGIIELLIGFWATGRFARSAYILILYVGVIALARAITDIVNAFRLRRLEHASAAAAIPNVAQKRNRAAVS
jgi:uncharacterized membrane protein HdeD (DUF308 family)